MVDDTPGPYCMSYNFSLTALINSIKMHGIINPPLIVFKRGKGRAHVVSGYRRVIALKQMNQSETDFFDVTESGMSEKELLMLNLYENLTIRELNPVEKAMVISNLSKMVSEDEVIEFMPHINLSSDKRLYNIFIEILSYPDDIKRSIASGHIPVKTLQSLSDKFNGESRKIILDLISKLKLSFNYQLQFIDILKDISFNKKQEVIDILNDPGIVAVIKRDKMNPPQKAKAIMETLKEMRYPVLRRFQREFSRRISTLDLPEGIRIEPPPYFESDQFKFEVRFSNEDELRKNLNRILRIKGLNRITDIT